MFREATNLYAYRIPPPDAEGLPLVASEEEKFQRAGQSFQQLADTYPGSRLAPLALYYSGNCRYRLKQYSGALEAFDQFIARFPRQSLVGQAHVAKGDCLEQLGRYPDAFQAYQLAAPGAGPVSAEARLGMARCLLKISETDRARWSEAVDLLNRLAAEPDGYAARSSREIRKLLADLSGGAASASGGAPAK
jgi:TolA-binding protein